MQYELSPTLQKFVEGQVAKGAYESTDKVVEAALKLLSERELEYERLSVAFRELENGDHHPLDMKEIRQMGQELLDSRRTSSECYRSA